MIAEPYGVPASPDWVADALDSVAIVRRGIDNSPLLRVVERDYGYIAVTRVENWSR